MTDNANILDQMKKVLLTGVGLAVKTWAEVEAAGKDAIRKAELADPEAKKFLKNLKENFEKTQETMEEKVKQVVKDALKKADIATRADVKDLWDEIRTLKRELRATKAPKPSRTPRAKAPAKRKTASRAKKASA
jgi:polyhydroxyalkanoate synthesis regulator phasin